VGDQHIDNIKIILIEVGFGNVNQTELAVDIVHFVGFCCDSDESSGSTMIRNI
jgi:hypothetical protein